MYFKCKNRQCGVQEKCLKYIEFILKSEEHMNGERNGAIIYP